MERMARDMPFMLQYEHVAWFEKGKVRILDRRVYPTEVRFVVCTDYHEVVQAIADMVTQSAGPYTAVGMGMALAAKTNDSNCLAVHHRQITILIIVLFNHSYRLLFFRVFPVFSFVTFLFCKAPFDACDACTANFNDIIAGYHIHKAVQCLRRACQFNNHTVFGKVDDLSSIYIHDFA